MVPEHSGRKMSSDISEKWMDSKRSGKPKGITRTKKEVGILHMNSGISKIDPKKKLYKKKMAQVECHTTQIACRPGPTPFSKTTQYNGFQIKNNVNFDADSSSDDSTNLIDIKGLSNSPFSSPIKLDDTRAEKVEKILSDSSNKYQDYIESITEEVQDHEELDTFASIETLIGDSHGIYEEKKAGLYQEPTHSRKALYERLECHFDMIQTILATRGKDSYFHNLASQEALNSKHETMSQLEKSQLKNESFLGGYYGLKRQLFIGHSLLSRFKKELRSYEKKDRTISYWTYAGYANYVLANEVIMRLIMEDYKCSMEDALSIMRKSYYYGISVTDKKELKDDIDMDMLFNSEDKELMKRIMKDTQTSEYKPPFLNSSPTKSSNLLDKFLDDISSESE